MKKAFAVLAALILLLTFSFRAYSKDLPYVILISMDGMRYDQPSEKMMPFLDSIGDAGVKAYSLRPVFPSKTFPNHLSIITGMYPQNHGIIANSFINPNTGEEYALFNRESVIDPKWYDGEPFWETAKKNGIRTASYFWPGSEMTLDYRSPDYFMRYNHDTPFPERVDSVLGWINLPYKDRPHFMTLYFHEPDSKSHEYGPDSEEVKQALPLLDSMLMRLFKGIDSAGMKDSINVIILSDHGMTDVSSKRTVDIEKILDGKNVLIQNYGTFAMIDPKDEDINEIYNLFYYNQEHYKAFTKGNIPEHYHYHKHPFISPIILIADSGWLLTEGSKTDSYITKMAGTHGFDNNHLDMHSIFFAAGPVFKNGYRTGTLWNIDIYPLLCRIFNIEPSPHIDGKIERIGFILKDE